LGDCQPLPDEDQDQNDGHEFERPQKDIPEINRGFYAGMRFWIHPAFQTAERPTLRIDLLLLALLLAVVLGFAPAFQIVEVLPLLQGMKRLGAGLYPQAFGKHAPA
jgi:hypothetical protein